MALSLGLPQVHQSGALMPRGSPMWGLAHHATKVLCEQRSSRKIHWLLHQYLTPHLRCQPTQEPIQHLSRGCIGYTQ